MIPVRSITRPFEVGSTGKTRNGKDAGSCRGKSGRAAQHTRFGEGAGDPCVLAEDGAAAGRGKLCAYACGGEASAEGRSYQTNSSKGTREQSLRELKRSILARGFAPQRGVCEGLVDFGTVPSSGVAQNDQIIKVNQERVDLVDDLDHQGFHFSV